MKLKNLVRRYRSRVTTLIVSASMLPVVASAQDAGGADYSQITSGVDWGSATTAIVGVGGLLALSLAAITGVRLVLRIIGGR